MRHQLELQSLEQQKQEDIHQAKLRFFTNIAHEFCNSLTLIYGPSEQLLKMSSEDTNTKKYLNIIKSNAERMQGLIQQLMEFRKAETGYLAIQVELVDIPELIKYTTDHFVDIAEQKKIVFNIDIDSSVNTWPTDRSCFEKILFNLLSNAFKYTPEQGTVDLKVFEEDNLLKFSVTNTGTGIKEEDQKQIFNRFRILDRLENQILKGFETRSGIGLALCKSLVDLLQGDITVSSKINEYTSFSVSLRVLKVNEHPNLGPVVPPDDFGYGLTSYPVASQELPVKDKDISSNKYSILIIEDDAEIRMLLNDILRDQYEVIQAANGMEAFEIIQNRIPDIILCDIIMPEVNGVEVVRRLKSQELTAHIPIIFLSSEGSIERQIEGIQVGADAYLTKPFHTRHLEVTIEQVLNNRQSLKQYFDSPLASIENIDGKLIHKEEKEFIVKLTTIVSDHMDDEKLSLDMLSKEMGISKIQLYRKLKEIKGQTPTEFIRKIRLKHAEKLLKTTNQTVQEIMYHCGFNNKAYFYREFAKLYKQTPKEYRNSQQPE
jgi:DNA-binding response OmpR family regulator/nitrogen-specific signal transduction histidine kinase